LKWLDSYFPIYLMVDFVMLLDFPRFVDCY
jgi:hypothetical protein